MATLRQRVQAFFNPSTDPAMTQEVSTATSSAPSAVTDAYEKLKADRDRMAIIKTCRLMYDSDTRVKKAHRFYARDIVRAGFIVKTKNEEAKQIADDLQKRLKMNQLLEDAVRLTSRDGDSFYEVVIAENLQITKLSRKPTLEIRRNTNKQDEFENPARAFWMSSNTWMSPEPPKDATWFANWQMIHARWEHDEEDRYGTPMFSSATSPFKKVQEGELNVAVRRKMGGAQIRQHIVEGSPTDLEKYKEDNKASFGKISAVTDLFTNKPSSLVVHQGDGTIDKIGDVTHHVATMMTASDVPMELIAYGEGLNRDILGEKKEEYEETLSQGREWLTDQLVAPVLERQWLLAGILPEAVDYEIIWRKARPMTPADVRDLMDALAKAKLLGMKDEVIQAIAASYLRDVDDDILSMDGFSIDQFAQNLKGSSV
jgi:hypothetical protein